MKSSSPLFIFFILILFSSCGSIQTYTDYDEEINYRNLTSFDFYKDMETGFDDLEEKRFKNALKEKLAVLQVEQTTKNPDFKVNFYSEIFQENHRHNIGVNIGTIGRNVSGNIGSRIPINTTKHILSITIEFAHPENNEMFWQGITEAKINPKSTPEEKKKQLEKMLKKLLKDFPPK